MKTEQYWEQRYARGGNSGDGSYGDLALFKAQVINDYIKKLNIMSMNDWGIRRLQPATILPRYRLRRLRSKPNSNKKRAKKIPK